MARSKLGRVKLNHSGLASILKSQKVAQAVHRQAETIADAARASEAVVRNELTGSVEVRDYVTDRAASSVTITHPAGIPIEAKHGTLARAAESTGHKVTSR